MFDRVLSLAGEVAFAAHEGVTATLERPWAILLYVALLAANATGIWWILLVVLPALFMTDSRRQMRNTHDRVATRHGRQLVTESPPVGDFSAAPVVGAVALVVVALLVDLPTPALTVFMRLAIAAVAAIMVLGWRVGYVVFRPRALAGNPLSTSIGVGESVAARASGRLFFRDVVFRVQVGRVETWHAVAVRSANPDAFAPAPVRLHEVRVTRTPVGVSAGVGGAPDETRMIVVTPGGEAGLALCRPDISSIESGVLRLRGGDRPAVRLATVVGPLALSFDTSEAMASVYRILTEELGR